MYIIYKILSVTQKPEWLQSQFKKSNALPGLGKPEAYSQKKNQTVQTGYSHNYISTYAKHNGRQKDKLEN